MALFGTPTVIGQLTSSSTAQLSYTVPISASNALGDTLFVVVSASTANLGNGTPASITDSQNPSSNPYTLIPNTPIAATSAGTLSVWQLSNSKVLSNTDTLTVTFPVSTANVKSVIVVDCPGAVTVDTVINPTNSATSTAPNTGLGTVNSFSYELIFFVTNVANAGGSPTVNSPYTKLLTLHAGSSVYTTLSYDIDTTGPGVIPSGTETITSAPWTAIIVGFTNFTPTFTPQYPYYAVSNPQSLAFNPSLILKPPLPQIPNPPTLTNINIAGVTANVSVNATFADATETIYTQSNQSSQLQPDGIPYPLSMIGQLQNLPRQVQTGPQAFFLTGVPATVSVASGGGVPAFLNPYFLQFPWLQFWPGLQFNPSLNWVVQQHSTGNLFVNIDGGTPSNVSVTAQLPGIATVVSVSATVNVNVVAVIPIGTVSGVTANVNVVAPVPVPTITVTGTVANVNVSAKAGIASQFELGPAANVTVASSGQTVTLGPSSAAANVNVRGIAGTTVDTAVGVVANISVASSGLVTESAPGTRANVNVVVVTGVVTESISALGQVTVASTGLTIVALPGTASAVSVTAPAGTPVVTKVIVGVTANVNVSSLAKTQVSPQGVTASVAVLAPAGTISRNIAGPVVNIVVKAANGFAGLISLSGTLYSQDLAMDQILSREGDLLELPVDNDLVSETTQPVPQGI